MLVGEFARLTGLTPRMLRHYEHQGLLTPAARDENGYRRYDQSQVDTAQHVRSLVAAGLPTRVVRDLLDTLTEAGGIYPEHVDPGVVQTVHDEWARMCRCVDCMKQRRDALRSYLDELQNDTRSD